MSKFASALFLLIIAICPTLASEPLPVKAYAALPKLSMLEISPSGKRYAYRMTDDQRDIMVIQEIGNNEAIGVIDISQIKPTRSYYVDDDTLIMVVSYNKTLMNYVGSLGISAAYAYNIEKKRTHQLLTLGYGILEGQTDLGNVVGISNNAEYAYVPAWESEGEFALMKTRLSKRNKPKAVRRGIKDAIDFFIYDDQIVARERYNNQTNMHQVEALIDDKWRKIFRQETRYLTKGFVGMTADIKSLVMKSAEGSNNWRYYTVGLEDGKVSGPIFNQDGKDAEYTYKTLNRVVQGVRYAGFKPSYEFLNPNLNKQINTLLSEHPDYAFEIVSYSPDWKHILFLLEGSSSSGDYYLFSNGQLQFLTSRRPQIPAEYVNQVYETSIKARDGLHIPTLLTLPAVDKLENLPAVMLPHGGPRSYDKVGFHWMAQFFASRGYLVIQPQFRGSKGFGIDFTLKGRGEWGRKMQDDLTDTLKTLIKSGYVDKDRACIVGGSYGGYAALAGAAFTPELYKCAISINGVSDVDLMLKDTERRVSDESWVVDYWKDLLSSDEFDEDHLVQISPINHVEKINSPVLLLHGVRDRVVPKRQSEKMHSALKKAGKEVRYISLKNGDHSLSSAQNRLIALEAMEAFLHKHLGQ